MSTGFTSARRPTSAVLGSTTRTNVIVCIVLLAAGLASLVSTAPLTVLAAGASLAWIIYLLWAPNQPPLFLVPVVFQWTQVAVKPLLTVVYDRPIDQVLEFGYHVPYGSETAVLFGFAGLSCLAFGIWVGGRSSPQLGQRLRDETRQWNGPLVLRLALGAIVLGRFIGSVASLAGSAYQLALALEGIEFVGLFVFAYWCLVNRTGYRYLIAVMGFETLFGMIGFFADFKLPIFVLAAAVLAARPSFRAGSIALMVTMFSLAVVLGVFWSEIKDNYRSFANENTGAQAALQSVDARADYIYNAAVNFDGAQFSAGLDKFLSRHSYVDFLGATLNYVPGTVPHQGGRLIGAALQNMLMPRVLFPDKPPLPSDTDVTSEFTGIYFYTAVQDTSISIGYLGELYIDFGYSGALIAMAVIGAALGYGVRYLRDYGRGPLLIRYGTCAILALSFVDFGTALVKALNGVVLAFAAAIVMQRVIAPQAISLLIFRLRSQRAPLRPVRRG